MKAGVILCHKLGMEKGYLLTCYVAESYKLPYWSAQWLGNIHIMFRRENWVSQSSGHLPYIPQCLHGTVGFKLRSLVPKFTVLCFLFSFLAPWRIKRKNKNKINKRKGMKTTKEEKLSKINNQLFKQRGINCFHLHEITILVCFFPKSNIDETQ